MFTVRYMCLYWISTILVYAIREHLTVYIASTFYMHNKLLEINNLFVPIYLHNVRA